VATIEQPAVRGPGGVEPDAERRGPVGLLRVHPELTIGAALLALGTALVLWARTRPGFDPYGWLVWGHQTLAGNLDTNAAPSWKPLPYVFTTPFALAGHYQLWLWMIASVAIALSGSIFAGRIAYRLTGGPAERRWPAVCAGVFAGVALLGIQDYWHYILSYQSDPLIVALCLGAVDAHLSGRPRWAFAFACLASLGRPEVWPFAGLYALWAWRAIPAMRKLIVAGVAIMLALWFGIPALTSRTPFVAASNALGSGRRLHSDKVFGTIHRFLELHSLPLELAALAAVVIAIVHRDRITLAIAAVAACWVVIEIAFSLHGWPGLGRYMFPAAGLMVALAGVAVGRLLAGVPELSGLPLRAGHWLGPALVVVLVASLVPSAVSSARTEHRDLRSQRVRTHQINGLSGLVGRLGGPARFKPCGEPLTRLEFQTIVAWTLHVNVSTVGFKYGPAIASGRPVVLLTPVGHTGWRIQPLNQRLPSCRTLRASVA
jgi:hypothetical protein